MSDEFGTVNVRPGDRAREIEVLRGHYREHREALAGLVAGAPTEYLANEYQRLIREMDIALGKLDELEGKRATAPGTTPLPPPPQLSTPPGRRGLAQADIDARDPNDPGYIAPAPRAARSGSRVLLIVLIGLAVLGAIGWMAWRASRPDEDDRPPAVVEAPVTETTTADTTIAPLSPPSSSLAVSPGTHDYGVIRKGTRVTRQFVVRNTTDQPISIEVARSACRCMFYEYASTPIAPQGRETVTVTIDGTRAKAGQLQETIAVKSKSDASVATSFSVTADVR